jgi:hypothetical protein
MPGLRQAGAVVDLDHPPYLRRSRGRRGTVRPAGAADPAIRTGTTPAAAAHGQKADGIPERRDSDVIVAEEARCLVQAWISQLT